DEKFVEKVGGGGGGGAPSPPVAQAIFLAIYAVRPLSVTAFKVAMSLFDLLTVAATMLVLARLKMDPARAIIYAWHPLVIWEGIHSGHVDPVFIAFLALALLAWVYKKNALTGVAVALATLVKLYPVMLLPVFLVNREETDLEARGSTQTNSLLYAEEGDVEPPESAEIGGSCSTTPPIHGSVGRFKAGSLLPWHRLSSVLLSKSALYMIVGFAATIVLCFVPYITVGTAFFRDLPDYFKEEGFVDQGGRYFLLALLRKVIPIPTLVYVVLAAAALIGLAIWWLLRPKRDAMDIVRGALSLIGLYLLLISPRYPWYFCWIVPWLCFLPRIGWFYLTGAT